LNPRRSSSALLLVVTLLANVAFATTSTVVLAVDGMT
jgi:hypothetical protein